MTAVAEAKSHRLYFLARLADNLARAEAEYARIEGLVLEARARGVDTSTFDPRTSAQSSDQTLRKAAGRVTAARKALEQYEAAGRA